MYSRNPDDRLRSLERQRREDPNNFQLHQMYVHELRRLGMQEEIIKLGYRGDTRKIKVIVNGQTYNKREKMGNRQTQILNSGILEAYKINYVIIFLADIMELDLAPGDKQELRHRGCVYHSERGTIFIEDAVNLTPLLWEISKAIVAQFLEGLPPEESKKWFKRRPGYDPSNSLIKNAESVIMVLLHWYFKIPMIDDVRSFLDALARKHGYSQEYNENFVMAFKKLRNDGFLTYLEPTTTRLSNFIKDNYENYTKIEREIVKLLNAAKNTPLLGPVDPANSTTKIISAKVTVLLKNGIRKSTTINRKVYQIARLIGQLSYFRRNIAKVEVLTHPENKTVLTREFVEESQPNPKFVKIVKIESTERMRRNPDEEIRKLEQELAMGNTQARWDLYLAKDRINDPSAFDDLYLYTTEIDNPDLFYQQAFKNGVPAKLRAKIDNDLYDEFLRAIEQTQLGKPVLMVALLGLKLKPFPGLPGANRQELVAALNAHTKNQIADFLQYLKNRQLLPPDYEGITGALSIMGTPAEIAFVIMNPKVQLASGNPPMDLLDSLLRKNPGEEDLRKLEQRLKVEDSDDVVKAYEAARVRHGIPNSMTRAYDPNHELPMFQHDCPDSCTFLGHFNNHDLYVCSPAKATDSFWESVIARFGSEGPDYASTPAHMVAEQALSKRHYIPELIEAWTRSVQHKLLKFPKSRGEDLTNCRYCGEIVTRERSGSIHCNAQFQEELAKAESRAKRGKTL